MILLNALLNILFAAIRPNPKNIELEKKTSIDANNPIPAYTPK